MCNKYTNHQCAIRLIFREVNPSGDPPCRAERRISPTLWRSPTSVSLNYQFPALDDHFPDFSTTRQFWPFSHRVWASHALRTLSGSLLLCSVALVRFLHAVVVGSVRFFMIFHWRHHRLLFLLTVNGLLVYFQLGLLQCCHELFHTCLLETICMHLGWLYTKEWSCWVTGDVCVQL